MTTMTRYDGSTAMATDGPEEGPDTGQESSESLLRRYKETGDDALKWELVLRFENQIRRIAARAYGVGLGGNQLEDVVHEGLLTLLGAVDRFDPDKGVKLETYVTKRLRGMMIDLSRKEDWLPRQLRQKFTKVNRAVDELSVELGRTPYGWEVARRLDMSLKEYEKTLSETAGYRRPPVVQAVVAHAHLFAILQPNNLRHPAFNTDWHVTDVEDFRIRAQTTRGFCDNGCRVGVVEHPGIW